MNDQKQELIEKLKGASNILVTVSSSPSVDQLAACIGLTIMLNKLKKHATAVFSGAVPSTIEFLKPDETLEKNTDSLRDFIIALDKSKADKLRYKVEENVVKIFITPYKTSISQDDLDFSQGDFNVDVVLTLGVQEQKDLDQAITAHGRILHDATVASINLQPGSELGTINWTDPAASSLSELAVEVADALGKDQMDAQIATALLTGIVAETERFSNEKTSPETMRLSAELMTAGANQQLVANELQTRPAISQDEPVDVQESTPEEPSKPPRDDGTLEITHNPADEAADPAPSKPAESEEQPAPAEPTLTRLSHEVLTQAPAAQGVVDADGAADLFPKHDDATPPSVSASPHLVIQPPTLGGQLTANTEAEGLEDSVDPLSSATTPDMPLLQHETPGSEPITPTIPLPEPVDELPPAPFEPTIPSPSASGMDDYRSLDSGSAASTATLTDTSAAASQQIHIDPDGNLQMPTASSQPASAQPNPASPPAASDDNDDQTLTDIEQSVHSSHLAGGDVDVARSAVMDAINSAPVTNQPLEPKQDVGAAGYLNVQDLPDSTDSTPSVQPPAGPSADAVQPDPVNPTPADTNEPAPSMSPADTPLTMPLPPAFSMPPANPTPPTSTTTDPAAPPPVPPPMTDLPPFNPPK